MYSCWSACEGGTDVVVVIVRVLMAQIKYDPISRCKPRNNGIDFISISARGGETKYDADGGIGWFGGLDRGKEGRTERRGWQIKQWFKGGGGRVLGRKVLVRGRGGCEQRILRVHIERRMSDVQRARHVVVESLAEVRREKRNRDVVGDGADGMRKKGEREGKGG